MYRHSFAVSLLFLCGMGLTAAAQDKATPPPDLVQYVRDAKKSGLNDGQIESIAVKAGWTTADVGSAMALVRTANPPAKNGASEAPPETGTGAGTVHPGAPARPPVSAAADKPAGVPGGSGTPAAAKATEKAATVSAAAPAAGGPVAAAPGAPEHVKSKNVPDDYRIGAGDVVQINVWGEPAASVPNAVVRPDGKISMPLIKELDIVGLTETEAEKLITGRLTGFISVPDVTVVIAGINSKKIYFVGEVNKQSPISYTYQMTVMQAISEAGGLTPYAKRKKIYILHNEDGRSFQYPFNYDEVLRGEHMEQNRLLMPGDTIVVNH